MDSRPAGAGRDPVQHHAEHVTNGELKALTAEGALRTLASVSAAAGVAISLFDMDGHRLWHSGWRRICTDFHRVVPGMCELCERSDHSHADRLLESDGPVTYECGNGLVLTLVPLRPHGALTGTLIVSQFLLSEPDEEAFAARAAESGVDVEAYLAALKEVTVVDSGRLATLVEILLEQAAWTGDSADDAIDDDLQAVLDREFLLTEAQAVARLGIYVLDIPTGMWSTSPTLDEIFGIDDDYVRSIEGWTSIVHPDDREMMAEYFATEVIGKRHPFDKEYRIARASDGVTRWVHGMGRLDIDGEGNPVRMLGTIQDITDRRMAQAAIEKSLTLYQDLVETSQDLIWQVDHEGRYTYLNPAWEDVMGYTLGEMLGRPFSDFQSAEIAEKDQVEFARLLQGGLVKGYESTHIAKDGRPVILSFNAKALVDENGQIAGTRGTAYDITSRRAAERELELHRQRLGELAADLLSAGERERHRIAVSLHDGIGQMLAAAKMRAAKLEHDMAEDEASAELARVVELIGAAIDEVRALTNALSPLSLYELGLGSALQGLCESHLARYDLDCTLEMTPEVVGLTNEAASIVFRSVRELLNNVHRHSGVALAHVSVYIENGELVARVEDEGRGFEVDSALTNASGSTGGGHFGLLSIREEATLAGGMLKVESEPGAKTVVEVRIPLGVTGMIAASRGPRVL